MLTPAEYAWQRLVEIRALTPSAFSYVKARREGLTAGYVSVLCQVPGKTWRDFDKILRSADKAAKKLGNTN